MLVKYVYGTKKTFQYNLERQKRGYKKYLLYIIYRYRLLLEFNLYILSV